MSSSWKLKPVDTCPGEMLTLVWRALSPVDCKGDVVDARIEVHFVVAVPGVLSDVVAAGFGVNLGP